jgi:hypothetical protein
MTKTIMTSEKVAGRPPKPINWTLFEDLCGLQCTQSEIASVLHINPETLRFKVRDHYDADYPAIYKKFSEHGKASLRRIQLKLAQKSAAMAIFLGKQYLGQKDNESMIQIPPEMMDNYTKLMNQLSSLQLAAYNPPAQIEHV